MFWKKLRRNEAREIEAEAAEQAAAEGVQRRLSRLARHRDGGDEGTGADSNSETKAALNERFVTCAFTILGVPMDADPSAIAAAVDDLAFAEDVDSQALEAAQAELLAPRDRIRHELAWLPEADNDQQSEARQALKNGDVSTLLDLRLATSGLARINLGMALLAVRGRDVDFQRAVVMDLLEWDAQATHDRIDEARLRGRGTASSAEHFDAALADYRRDAGRIMAQRLSATREGRDLLAQQIEHSRAEIRACAVPMLEAIANEYGALADAKLQNLRGKIADAITALTAQPRDPAKVTLIITTLDLWSQWRTPQQKLEEARGLDDPLSAELFSEIRELAITLSNEHKLFDESLRLGRALKHAFGAVPSLKHKVEQDLPMLIGNALFKRFEQLAETTAANIRKFATEIERSGIGAETGGHVGKVCDVFEELVETKPDDETAFLVMRALMIKLANETGRGDVALEMVEYLLDHGAPGDVRNRLVQDMCQIQKQLKESR
ncbi:MAG: hypothetical protein WBA51_11185 [Erythrobacter sp.]